MIFVIVVGFIVGPLGLVLAVYYARRRCPKCHKYTLRQDSQRVLSVTHNYRLVEYTYVCPNCGAVVKRQARNLRDDNFGEGSGRRHDHRRRLRTRFGRRFRRRLRGWFLRWRRRRFEMVTIKNG